jgi:hypothetical protein
MLFPIGHENTGKRSTAVVVVLLLVNIYVLWWCGIYGTYRRIHCGIDSVFLLSTAPPGRA